MKRIVHVLAIFFIFALSSCSSTLRAPIGEQSKQTLIKEITQTVTTQYLLYLPKEYEQKESWPLLLFLHGAGERGDSLDLVKVHGPPKLIENGKDFPFIVVSPQCPTRVWWSTDVLDALLNEIVAKYRVDENRIYLTGLSMGGYGTWKLAMEYPNRFAVIAPICGGGDAEKAHLIKHVPAWVFHGAKDNVVPLKNSEDMVDALKEAGAEVEFTVYPEAGHDSWTETYDNPALYEWFLKYKRR